MKKLAYITLIAAFVFGVQPQEAFSTENNAIDMEKGGKGEARIAFDQNSETLLVSMRTAGAKESVQIYVANAKGTVVAKEIAVVGGQGFDLKMDLRGLPGGVYQVKVISQSIRMGDRFKKK